MENEFLEELTHGNTQLTPAFWHSELRDKPAQSSQPGGAFGGASVGPPSTLRALK